MISFTKEGSNNELRGSGEGSRSTFFSSAVSVSFPLETSVTACEPGCTTLVNVAVSGAKLLNTKNVCFRNSLEA